MLTLIQDSLFGQYGAAFTMLHACLEQGDDAAWLAPVGRIPFWHVAYHVLFFTDLYLSPDEKSFQPPAFHIPNSNFFGPPPWAPTLRVNLDRPYDRPTLIGYLATLRTKAAASLPLETEASFAGPSGFSWLPFSRLQLHIYNIRHIQHHTGSMAATLRRVSEATIRWTLSEPSPSASL